MLYRLALIVETLALLAAPASALAETSELVDASALRVCSDPANMPFSNNKNEGFENKIADLLAKDLGVPVTYAWFPQVTGFVRNTLSAGKCDVVMGFAQGDEVVQNTNAYYRSTYALVYKAGNGLDGVDRLTDGRLKEKRIGITAGTPPVTILAQHGMLGQVKSYALTVDRRYESPAEQMIADIRKGDIDAGVLWGPIGGYFAKTGSSGSSGDALPLTVTPLVHENGQRMIYRITLGVRASDQNWKRRLNDLLRKDQGKINEILFSYGVPLLDEQDQPIAH
jgi:quinoprotein dehydrogenase-associated probable ABC transporter substrate-binding protein